MTSEQEHELYKRLIIGTARTAFQMLYPSTAQIWAGDEEGLMGQVQFVMHNDPQFCRSVECIVMGAIDAFRKAEWTDDDRAREHSRIAQQVAQIAGDYPKSAGVWSPGCETRLPGTVRED